jgi:hypothetical protein
MNPRARTKLIARAGKAAGKKEPSAHFTMLLEWGLYKSRL